MSKQPTITTEEFDRKFERGEDLAEHLDFARASRPGLKTRRVNVDLPEWMIEALDREARRLGVTRQSVIKVWIDNSLKAAAAKAS